MNNMVIFVFVFDLFNDYLGTVCFMASAFTFVTVDGVQSGHINYRLRSPKHCHKLLSILLIVSMRYLALCFGNEFGRSLVGVWSRFKVGCGVVIILVVTVVMFRSSLRQRLLWVFI